MWAGSFSTEAKTLLASVMDAETADWHYNTHHKGYVDKLNEIEKALVEVRDRYDYVLIDTPPSLGLLTINAFTASTGVIVPVQLEYLSLRGLVQLESTLQMIREHLNPVVRIEGILPTMVEGRTVHGREALDLLQANFHDLVFETRIKKSVKLAEAPVQGGSVLSYQPDGIGANSYRALAEEAFKREVPENLLAHP